MSIFGRKFAGRYNIHHSYGFSVPNGVDNLLICQQQFRLLIVLWLRNGRAYRGCAWVIPAQTIAQRRRAKKRLYVRLGFV